MSISLTIKRFLGGEQTNEWLMTRYSQTGDKNALNQLYDNCSDDLYHYLVTHSDIHLAKDVCHKTWVKIIEKPYLFKGSGRFKAWLFSIGRNTLIDEFRKNNRWMSLPEHSEPCVNMQIDECLSVNDTFNRVIEALPFEQREAFCLQQEGFGLQEIANITHTGVETVKSRIRYAKNTLRAQLESDND